MQKQIAMQVVHPHAAGIDVGSRSHFVAIGQSNSEVRQFGVYSEEYDELVGWLLQNGITTVAMESTGNYWQTLSATLHEAGLHVLLVNGQQIKNIKGKTDVLDCQWIQRLHTLGLLTGSFLPSAAIETLRTYHRQRVWLVQQAAALVNKMQKALRLMNLRLDVAISDITGATGQAIIQAILQGERCGERLAEYANVRIRKSKTELAAALQGQWREEHLFELQQCFSLYQTYQQKIAECDEQIEQLLQQPLGEQAAITEPVKLKKKRAHKNQPNFQLPQLSYQQLQVDLFAIEGVSHSTVLTFLSEVGPDIHHFTTAKHFASWLRLAPCNKISGGKRLCSRTPKGKNAMAIALRNAANTIGNARHGLLRNFFARIAFKKGRAAAITATARKLAVIIWNMVTRKQTYKPLEETLYLQKVKSSTLNNMVKKMKRLNLNLSDLQPLLMTS